jgi:hypothetical protein
MQFAFTANQHLGRFSEDVYADVPGLQETSGERFESKRQASAYNFSGEEAKKPRKKMGGKISHDQTMEVKGKDKKKDCRHDHKWSRK